MSSATPRWFGTDGIRAPFGTAPLDRPTVTLLGRELGRSLAAAKAVRDGDEAPEVVLGGDTRESTPEITAWLAAGLAAGGAVPRPVGVVPTAGVAHLVRSLGASGGAVVSASHNPWPDNGIKLFDLAGFKWEPEAEARLEERVAAALENGETLADDSAADDEATAAPPSPEGGLVERWLDAVAGSIPATDGRPPLAGLSIGIDAGNGAASPWARGLFERLGARVLMIHDRPDGRNVNAGCGATDPEDLAALVTDEGLDLGVALDGDADRSILVDDRGAVRDGDAILYLWATDLARRGLLDPPAIVATSMSNLGLARALESEGIGLVRCGVGDREVVRTLRREGLVLGGEQSGHIVHLDLTTTGDGLLTAVQTASRVARAGQPLSRLLEPFRRFPQVLINVPVAAKPPLDELDEVAAAARDAEEALGDEGRLVLRYSGTEPLARVMIEGPERAMIEELAAEVARALERTIGSST